MQFIEPLRDGVSLADRLSSGEYKKVVILFGHGLGDCIMFIPLLERLKELFPSIEIKIALQNGLDEETILPECILFNSKEQLLESNSFDICAGINFPVETDPNLTKAELCCKLELGIEPPKIEYKSIQKYPSKLCAVHFNITCLPHLANPEEKTAKEIWDDILEAGWIPIESHFEHVFHNPVNKKFEFIDCTVRRVVPRVSTLIGLLQSCGAFIGVVSGNFHCAMATMPHNRIAFLEKDIPVARFTHEDIKSFDLKDYKKGSVKEWLLSL